MSASKSALICFFIAALALPAIVTAQDDPISFVGDVVPIINAKCGRCHVNQARGKYKISTYKELMGTSSVEPGDADSSLFIELIESGEMPKLSLIHI